MITIKHVAPWLAAASIAGALALAPAASATTEMAAAAPAHSMSVGEAGTDPLLPFGTDPVSRDQLGYINPNHDEANTTNGEVDLPF